MEDHQIQETAQQKGVLKQNKISTKDLDLQQEKKI